MPLSATEQGIIVKPSSFTVDLIGGCNTTRDITVRWTGSDTIQCFISTNITSDCPRNDSEGINVTYSEPSPFDLPSNVDYTVEMKIEAAINIMPGNYTITTNFSCEAEEPEDDDEGDGGKGRGRSPANIPPVADASAGELYTGYVDEEITFNGSKSSDIDGTITEWSWDFGDGNNGTGEVTSHNYSTPGTYNVTLTVTDNDRNTDTYKTTVIIMQANRPPDSPLVDGVMLGNKTVEYAYTAVSTDPDNDTIRYFFDWGDGTNTISGFLERRLIYNTSHNWTTSGVYTVRVYAEDKNNGVSGTTEMTVFIDVNVLFIDDVIQGYILDTDADGIYDIFHNNATGDETDVELQNNGNYLIDGDGDTMWDYEYDPETNVLVSYPPLEEEDMAPWYVLFALILVVAITVIIFAYFLHSIKKQKRDKGQKKKKAIKKAK